jgi:phage minor structural protein
MDTRVVIYDNQMKKQAILENAFNIGYEKKLNELWTAFFSLPADDPKNVYCKPLAYAELFDQGERVELFRITPALLEKTDAEVNTYQCEHVLATLIDDVLFQYHEIGGTGIFTTTAINYVLSKQTVTRWELGQNDFTRQFLYKWENENLLGSLFSIPKPFLEDYQWTWDTTVYPWVINLVQISDQVQSYVRYRKNMQSIRREIDPTELCTRLYCLGYGEGVNQLTIKEVNNNLP